MSISVLFKSTDPTIPATTNLQVNWESYTVETSFMVPCDSFSFRIGTDNVSDDLFNLLQGGTQVEIQVNTSNTSTAIMSGQIDNVEEEEDSNGRFFNIKGRSYMAPMCDNGADIFSNELQMVEGETLFQLLAKVFAPYGIKHIYDSDANGAHLRSRIAINENYTVSDQPLPVVQNLLTENPTITYTQQKISYHQDAGLQINLTSRQLKHMKPHTGETSYEFAERVCKRFHCHVWQHPSSDTIFVGQPSYTYPNDNSFQIINTIANTNNLNNVKSVKRHLVYSGQPVMIFAKSHADHGDYDTPRYQSCVGNEFAGAGLVAQELRRLKAKYKGIVLPLLNDVLVSQYAKYFNFPPFPRVLYLDDTDSRTQDELDSYVRRKMSELQRHAFTLVYQVQGHDQNGQIWTPNTMVNVVDEKRKINGLFWVEAVRYALSEKSGTTTELTLIPPNIVVF